MVTVQAIHTIGLVVVCSLSCLGPRVCVCVSEQAVSDNDHACVVSVMVWWLLVYA